MQAQTVELEFILPVCNREDDVAEALENLVSGLRELAVPAAIAVVDCGSSDRTLERVDRVSAGSPVPIRTVGCSRPGWHAAALRGIATTAAHWVMLGHGTAPAGALEHAVRMLEGGRHVVCAGAATLLDPSAAAALIEEQAPSGPDFVPDPPDSVAHAGLRIAAVGRVAAPVPARLDAETTAIFERVAA